MKLYFKLHSPHEWVIKENKYAREHGVADELMDCPFDKVESCIALIDGEHVTCHEVDIPAKTRKQFDAAVPYALEEEIIQDIGEVIFSPVQWKANKKNVVMVVSGNKLTEWIQQCADLPRLEMMLPDYALLPKVSDTTYIVNHSEHALYVKASSGFAAKVPEKLLPAWLDSLPSETSVQISSAHFPVALIEKYSKKLNITQQNPSNMSNWIESLSDSASVDYNLLKGMYKPKNTVSYSDLLKLPLLVLFLAMIIYMLSDVYSFISIKQQAEKNVKEMRALIRARDSSIEPITRGNEKQIFSAIIESSVRTKQPIGFLYILSTITPYLNKYGVKLQSITYRGAQNIALTCELTDLSNAEQLLLGFREIENVKAKLGATNINKGLTIARYQLSYGNTQENE